MAKSKITGIVTNIFPEKRQNQLYKHQFIRIVENGTSNVFDVQFYNNKIPEIKKVKEGQKIDVLVFVNGRHWTDDETEKEGIFLKVNGQLINPTEDEIVEFFKGLLKISGQ